MDWYRAKTIMIVFLVVVNLGLGAYIIIDNINEKNVENSVSEEVIGLLEKNNIDVEKKLLLSNANPPNIRKVNADNIISDYFYFSKKILGENVKSFSDNVYENNVGKVTFNGDNFKAEAKEEFYLGEILTNEKNAKENAKKYLKSIGADIEDAIVKAEKKDNKFLVNFQRKINNQKIFKMYLTVELTNKGVVAIYGNWYNPGIDYSEIAELKDITGVMIEYMNQKGKSSDKIKIEKIDIGYVVANDNTFNESVYLIPVWKITDNHGDIKYINASM